MVVRGEEATRVPGIQVAVTDTTGAGDTFDAGFIAGISPAGRWSGASRSRTSAAASPRERPGGVAAQPTMEEALERLPEVEGRLAPP